jgi:hypothetical protein
MHVVEPPENGAGDLDYGPPCPHCGWGMQLAAALAQSGFRPAKRFYRCMVCKKVEMVDVE